VLSDYYKLEYGVTNPDTAAAVGIVEAWHEALNSGDTERLVTLSHPHVEVGGPHGTGHGTKLLQEWADRANIRLTPLRVFHLEAEFHRQGATSASGATMTTNGEQREMAVTSIYSRYSEANR